MGLSEIIGYDSVGRIVHRRVHVNSDGRRINLYSHVPIDQPPVGEALDRDPTQGELRWHPLRREWIIYAPARQSRTYKPAAANDPLAPMSLDGSATEIPFTDFELAVFENRFPSLFGDAIAELEADVNSQPASGRCDVVVYGPEARGSLATVSAERRRLLVAAWIDLYEEHFSQRRAFVLPFENRGEEVGVTLHHPHGQIYAFDFVPPVQSAAVQAFNGGFDLAGKLKEWREAYEVTCAGPLVLFAPPFARFPFELWIASHNPRRGLWDYDNEELEAYAFLLGETIRRYDCYFKRATPYMMSLQAAPRDKCALFQFTTQFYPLLRSRDKIKYLASVEQSTGVFTVDVTPEFTAKELRR